MVNELTGRSSVDKTGFIFLAALVAALPLSSLADESDGSGLLFGLSVLAVVAAQVAVMRHRSAHPKKRKIGLIFTVILGISATGLFVGYASSEIEGAAVFGIVFIALAFASAGVHTFYNPRTKEAPYDNTTTGTDYLSK